MRKADTLDDRQLLAAFVGRNDQGAFEQIVERHARWVFAAALRQLRDRHLAEDAVQIVFVIVAQKAHTMDTRQKLSGWLFNTLQFTVKNFRRADQSRRRHEANAAKAEMQEAPPDAAMVRECAEQIDAAVARLAKADRQAILLRFYQEMPFDQIARELGTKEAAARKRVERALAGLRRHLGTLAPTDSVLSAATAYGLEQAPASLVPGASHAAMAGNGTGTIGPSISAGAKQVAYLMAITKVQATALIAGVLLIVGIPASVMTWHAIVQDSVAVQPGVGSQGVAPAAMAATPTIGGIVRNEAGQALAGVDVHLEFNASMAGDNGAPPHQAFVSRDVRTGSDGRWTFSSALLTDASNTRIRLQRTGYGADESAAPINGALADQSAEFVMTRGIAITGTVVDQNGKPIPGAKVSTVQVWYVVNDPGKTVSVDSEGHFRFAPRDPGPVTLTTTAKGYGPDLQHITVAEGMGPVRIVLLPGKTIRACVVDENGKPVADANVRADRWRQMSSLQWMDHTDGEGRFVMHDAPDDGIFFQVNKEGYQAIINASLMAGDGESTVTLKSQPTASGMVTDADTGKPIEHFEVIYGENFRASTPPFFVFTQATKFDGGVFELPVPTSNGVAENYLRVEANGYEPAVTPPFKGNTSFKLTMRRGQDVRGSVVGADGSHIVGAQVILALPGCQVNLDDNHLRSADEVRVATTDAGGTFHFRPQSGKFQLLALCEAGYAMDPFDQEPTDAVELKISPWARIEGTISQGAAGGKSSRLSASITHIQAYGDTFVNYEFQYTPASAGGLFTIEKVPSFGGDLAQLGVSPSSGGGNYQRAWISMRLAPGQMARADLSGATVEGTLASPQGGPVVRTGDLSLDPLMDRPARKWPIDWTKENTVPPPLYDFQGGSHFEITGVRPGKYIYRGNFGDAPNYFHASGTLEIHADDVGKTIDLGNLVCTPASALKVGDAAPHVLGHTLDEAPIAVHDFAGKYVVGIMWISGFRQVDASAVELQLSKEFAANPRVTLLGLNLDANDAMNGIVNRPGELALPGWIDGYVPQTKFELILQLARGRPAIFIIGPDGKIVARDVPPGEVSATLRRLVAKP